MHMHMRMRTAGSYRRLLWRGGLAAVWAAHVARAAERAAAADGRPGQWEVGGGRWEVGGGKWEVGGREH